MSGHCQIRVKTEGVGEKEKRSCMCYDEEEAGPSGKKTEFCRVSEFGL